MKTKEEALDLTRGRLAGKRSVTVRLSQLAFEALAGEELGRPRRAGSGAGPRARFASTSRQGAGRLHGRTPGSSEDPTQRGGRARVEIDTEVWLQFEGRGGQPGGLGGAAARARGLYYAAELDAGRVTERILDDLDDE